MKVILASGSPRRREVMDQFKIPYQVIASNIAEIWQEGLTLEEQSKQIALEKAKAVWNITKELGDRIIIGADTIVVKDGKIYEKPQTREQAIQNFKEFSGKEQQVITSYAIIIEQNGKIEEEIGIDTNTIVFADMTEEDIQICLAKENVYDKAGGYNIASFSGAYIEQFNGNMTGVMGLPRNKIYQVLKKYGVLTP